MLRLGFFLLASACLICFISSYVEKCTNTREFNPYNYSSCHPPILLTTVLRDRETWLQFIELSTLLVITAGLHRLQLAAHQFSLYTILWTRYMQICGHALYLSILSNFFRVTVGTQISYFRNNLPTTEITFRRSLAYAL